MTGLYYIKEIVGKEGDRTILLMSIVPKSSPRLEWERSALDGTAGV